MKETLEDFLKRTWAEDGATPANYMEWAIGLSPSLMIAYAEKWHSEQMLAELNK